jgi:hypothetical protein
MVNAKSGRNITANAKAMTLKEANLMADGAGAGVDAAAAAIARRIAKTIGKIIGKSATAMAALPVTSNSPNMTLRRGISSQLRPQASR